MSITFNHFLATLLGDSFQFFAVFGDRSQQIVYHLLRSYYNNRPKPSDRTVKGLCNGNTPPSHMLVSYYSNESGRNAAYINLHGMFEKSVSIIDLRLAQDRVHDWITAQDLPTTDSRSLDQYYAPNADPAQIAHYIAAVMCYVISSHADCKHS